MTKQIVQWLQESIHDAETKRGEIAIGEMDVRIKAIDRVLSGDLVGRDLKEAMTVAHFTNYFGTALSQLFYKDYDYQVGQWKQYTYPDTSPDQRDVQRLRMTEPGTLVLRREKAEAKATAVAETMIHYGWDEYARQFDISWQTLLNDDLGKLAETPKRMANAAARFEDAFVSALYDNATTQAGMVALGAPWSGTGRLTAANLAIGIAAMQTRTDALGNPMNIKRIYLVIPPLLKLQADTILSSALMAGVATNDKNVLPGYIAGVFTDPYIATAAPNVPWYLFADPAEIPTVTVVRQQGVPGPFTYMKEPEIRVLSGTAPQQFTLGSFATGDIEYGVSDLIGGWDDATYVGATDWRGLYYSSGTTA
jgi:hypothetical protein